MSNTIIVWFRNDLRIRDNEALYKAVQDAQTVIPVYCIDPRMFAQTPFGFTKTGPFRAQFLLQSLHDLRFALRDLGADLVVKTGKPEEIIFALAKYHQAKAVYCHQEATDEEYRVEDALISHLDTIDVPLEMFWGSTLYHYDDLAAHLPIENLPDVFTQFRQFAETRLAVRPTYPAPQQITLPPNVQTGSIPTLQELGLTPPTPDARAVLPFTGGETAGLLRLKYYLWEKDLLKTYEETRNQLIGGDYSSKLSAWLALGCISARTVFEEVQRYEQERVKNKSTYWLIFELLWRDYFRFVAVKYGNHLFKPGGLKQVAATTAFYPELFERWAKGQTGIPFIDANMRELNATGFMSNRGRQNVASFLVKDMGQNWQAGAAWFEHLLIDYDVCSNYGNWNYIAGIGNDPRENRYFNVLTQAAKYDANGQYVKLWCPELRKLPSGRIHEPYLLQLPEQRYVGVVLGVQYPHPCIDIAHWRARQATPK
ncbi:DASH family cryptochrome [Sphingobacteriales bacterium UPWRP_1]|nr:cryptochrome DASH [Sphingobacteriales bacterium TSM_CSS]PSJ72582.1 DASH family cryptochrome [Sphingobacteriales bacterium UPWRP_1]